jgi:hypothetical protein
MRIRILIAAFAATFCAISPASADSTITGQFGEKISISANTFKGAQTVVVNGSNFDETVGIYLAYCVLPKKGALPTPCGGGVNKNGIGDASYWISSNPPPYGAGLAIPFTPGGRFSQKLEITKKIGVFDCTKVKCAVTVRSDHLHQGDRTHDLFIPISFSKK